MSDNESFLHPDRSFCASPLGYVDPLLFAGPAYALGTSTELLIIADHYITHVTISQPPR